MGKRWDGPLEPAGECRWRIPKGYQNGMRVDGIVYADETLIEDIRNDQALEQVANVATLPGIRKASFAMPDIHWGYGFCIGGVAATDPIKKGVVSPGGVGYDINCGVRLLRTNLSREELGDINKLVNTLFETVPCGVGKGGRLKLSSKEEKRILVEGAGFPISKGFGRPEDLENCEENGAIKDADPEKIGPRAYERGGDQCGTLGAGNHFIEVQVVDSVFDQGLADAFGINVGQVTVMVHSGSRGFGHQVCDDYLKHMRRCPEKYGISLPDRQLVCAPVDSPEGQSYLKAMRCAANYAWANRQMLSHLVREAFEKHFNRSADKMDLGLIYDVAHNIAKMEKHEVDGQTRKLCVHRKGATRAFPPGHPEVPERYRAIGQPVLIPGDMGRASYLLVGQQTAMEETFGSACHGAGRTMSRNQAIKSASGRSIQRELADRGVIARSRSRKGLDEEQPDAYKNVNDVVDVVHRAGLASKVCRMKPIGVIKG